MADISFLVLIRIMVSCKIGHVLYEIEALEKAHRRKIEELRRENEEENKKRGYHNTRIVALRKTLEDGGEVIIETAEERIKGLGEPLVYLKEEIKNTEARLGEARKAWEEKKEGT